MSAILDRAKTYSAEIHKRTRAQQLAWFGEQLEIAPETLLRLLGYAPKAIREKLQVGATVEELAEKKPDETLWVTEILRELVSQHGYEVDRVAKSFRQPYAIHPSTGTRKSGGGLKGMKYLLFRKVAAGGPQVYSDLTDLIRLTNGTPSASPAKRSRKDGRRRQSPIPTTY